MNEANIEYAAEYEHAGHRWALNFYALNDTDAAEKMASIKASGCVLGRSVGRIPAQPAVADESLAPAHQ